jgi:hypothetical protein
LALAGLLCSGTFAEQAPTSRLRLQQYVADEVAFHVVFTLIVGPTEVMRVDAQMRVRDGSPATSSSAAYTPCLARAAGVGKTHLANQSRHCRRRTWLIAI